jgi:hypothetical protein
MKMEVPKIIEVAMDTWRPDGVLVLEDWKRRQ